MARIRSIKPEFWTDPDVARLTPEARLLFIGTWTHADDHGYLDDDAERLLLQLFPGDRHLDAGHVAGWLDSLVDRGMLARLEDAEGRRLLRVVGWKRHQRIDRPSKSRYAVPEGKSQAALAPDMGEKAPLAPAATEGLGLGELSGKRKRPSSRRKKADPDTLPDDFPEALVVYVEPVQAILTEIAEGNGARSAVMPTRRAVAMALADFPHRDFLKVAKDYRAWQLGGTARTAHKNPVLGWRNQLDRAPDVLRPEQPGEAEIRAGRDLRERTEAALKEMGE